MAGQKKVATNGKYKPRADFSISFHTQQHLPRNWWILTTQFSEILYFCTTYLPRTSLDLGYFAPYFEFWIFQLNHLIKSKTFVYRNFENKSFDKRVWNTMTHLLQWWIIELCMCNVASLAALASYPMYKYCLIFLSGHLLQHYIMMVCGYQVSFTHLSIFLEWRD